MNGMVLQRLITFCNSPRMVKQQLCSWFLRREHGQVTSIEGVRVSTIQNHHDRFRPYSRDSSGGCDLICMRTSPIRNKTTREIHLERQTLSRLAQKENIQSSRIVENRRVCKGINSHDALRLALVFCEKKGGIVSISALMSHMKISILNWPDDWSFVSSNGYRRSCRCLSVVHVMNSSLFPGTGVEWLSCRVSWWRSPFNEVWNRWRYLEESKHVCSSGAMKYQWWYRVKEEIMRRREFIGWEIRSDGSVLCLNEDN